MIKRFKRLLARPIRADVVVVGAGLAGLTAARTLASRGLRIVVLEARERVGGRTLSHPLLGDQVDLGAQWVGPTQGRVLALARELGVATFPQFHAGNKVLLLGGRRSLYPRTVPSLPLLGLLSLQLAISRLDWLARQVPLERPYAARKAAAWDKLSVADWLARHVRRDDARAILRIAVNAIFAAEPEDLSLLFFLFYLRSGGGLIKLSEVRGGAQQDRLAGGAQQLAQRLAEALGERVMLGSPVTAIEQNDHAVTVSTPGARYQARAAIVALPPELAGAIRYTPELPPERTQLTKRMPMGQVIKCVVAYERPFWRAEGLSGEALCDDGPVRLVYDDSPPEGERGALVVFILGAAAKEWGARTRAERARAVCAELERCFGPQASQPLAYLEQNWPAEPWSKGCYVGICPPGALTSYGAALREPVGLIHWAGTETARVWNGYMDGAIESGERAAREVLERLG